MCVRDSGNNLCRPEAHLQTLEFCVTVSRMRGFGKKTVELETSSGV